MVICLIRHADPDYANDTLTPKGLAEAELLARYLRDVPFTHIYCSPLERAQATMQPVLAGRDLLPVTLPWLAELDHRMGLGQAAWNVTCAQLDADETLAARITEFMRPQQTQLLAKWDELMAEHGFCRTGRTYCRDVPVYPRRQLLAVFTHGGLLLTLLAGLFGLPLVQTYACTVYLPTGITHLEMLRGGEGFCELRMLSLAARPHIHVSDQLMLARTGGAAAGK